MAVTFPCDVCGKPVKAPSDWVGKSTRCPNCGASVIATDGSTPLTTPVTLTPAPSPPSSPPVPPKPPAPPSTFEESILRRMKSQSDDISSIYRQLGCLIFLGIIVVILLCGIMSSLGSGIRVTLSR